MASRKLSISIHAIDIQYSGDPEGLKALLGPMLGAMFGPVADALEHPEPVDLRTLPPATITAKQAEVKDVEEGER